MRVYLLLLLMIAGTATALEPLLDEMSRDGADPFIRSLLWPGLGQIDQGRLAEGAGFAGGAVLLSVALFQFQMDYHGAALDYRNAGDAYADAIENGDSDTAWENYQRLSSLHGDADRNLKRRNHVRTALLLWWSANLVDVWWHERGAPDRLHLRAHLRPDRNGLALSVDF